MAKKQSEKLQLPQDPGETNERLRERLRQQRETAWDREFEKINKEYGSAMEGAWRRYIAALHADPSKKSAGKDYDKKYDQERADALAAYHKACAKMNKAIS